MQVNRQTLERFLFKLKKKFILKKFLYFSALILLPLAGYLIGWGNSLKMENPAIIIDTSEIDCGCENRISEEVATDKEIKTSDSESGQTTIEQVANSLTDSNSSLGQEGQFVASKNGQKYYPFDCASANRIKEENKVYYQTAAEAEADGKELSSQCQ